MKINFRNIAPILLLSTAGSAWSETVSVNKDWEAYKHKDLCYAISFAKSSNETESRYLTVSNRPSENRSNEIAFVSGFDADYTLDGSVSVDKNLPFKLLTYKGVGFVKSGEIESMLMSQMKAGNTLQVKWTNEKGEYTVDKYSLLGFTASSKFIKNCN